MKEKMNFSKLSWIIGSLLVASSFGMFISLPFFIFFTIEGIITKKDPLYNKIPNKILITIIIIFIIYGILRNLPLFDFLAPTIVR